jgi:DNA-binding MarR family transcriptional regulator
MVKNLPVTPASSRPRGCTNFKLRQFMRQVTQHYDTEMATCGLRTTQYSLLTCVAQLGPIQPKALAQAMTMDASTLTRNLRPLLDAGWLLLGAGQDARSRLVHITEEGRVKQQEAHAHWRLAQQSLNQRLGTDTVAALHTLIDQCMPLMNDAAKEGADHE